MGHHWNPQAYLRHFACQDQPDHVWVYDKNKREWLNGKPLPIKTTAQASEFYAIDTETHLAAVEDDACKPLEKLRNDQQLTPVDREKVCKYLCAFVARSPDGRRVIQTFYKALVESELNGLASDLARQELLSEPAHEGIQAQKSKIEKVNPFRTQSELVKSFPSHFSSHSSLLPLISSLSWLVLRRPSSEEFVTGDSPLGCGQHHYQFALSTDLCLVCQSGPPQSTKFRYCSGHLARCINRMTIQWSQRFVYASSQHGWVPNIAEEVGRGTRL